SKQEGEQWIARLRAVTPAGWSIAQHGDTIAIQRDEPVEWKWWPINADAEPSPAAADLHPAVFRLTLKFGPAMSVEDYERLAAMNAASAQERDRLTKSIN